MGPMMLAAIFMTATTLANLSLDVGLNTLQNLSDTVYRDAFWTPGATPGPIEPDPAASIAGAEFRVVAVTRPELRRLSR